MKANVYKVDAAVIAGDLTGKALIAVVKGEDGGEAWTATVMGQRRVARDEAELVAIWSARSPISATTPSG